MFADMSSKAWVHSSNDVFAVNSSKSTLSMRKVASSHDLSEVFNDKPVCGAFDEIWKSIQSADQRNKASNWIPPYVHPLEKRSTSSLSAKSLEICTESLGSETGCHGYSLYDTTFFSSSRYSSSSTSGKDEEDNKNNHNLTKEEENEMMGGVDDHEVMMKNEVQVVKKASGGGPRAPINFPPPLPSLVGNRGSSNLIHMRSHRQDGRVVLEAVSVPSTQNCFRAEREGGRLILIFCPEGGGVNEQNDDEEEGEEKDGDYQHEECEFDEEQQGAGDDDVGEEDNDVEKESEEDEDECVREDMTDPSAGDDPQPADDAHSKLEENCDAAGDGIAIKDSEVVKNNNKFLLPNNSSCQYSLPPRPPLPPNAYGYYWRRSNKINNNLIQECGVALSPPKMKKEKMKVKIMMGLGREGGAAAPAVMVRDDDRYDHRLLTKNRSTGESDSQLGDIMQFSPPAISADCRRRRSLFFWDPYCVATATSS